MVAEIGEADVAALEAPGDEAFDGCAAELFAEDDDQRFLGQDRLAEIGLAGVERGGETCCSRRAEARCVALAWRSSLMGLELAM